MERDEILRDDFPTVRKGWQPEAVGAHLIAVADHVAAITAKPTPAADAASEQVGTVLAAAESAAAAIVAEAEAEADRIRADACAEAETESERTVSAADREASGRVEQARGAVEGLIAQADRLRAQIGAVGRDLASNVPGTRSEPPAEPDREPDPAPPEPASASLAEPAIAKAPPSDEELIAELRGGEFVAAQAATPTPAPAPSDSGSDQGAARLVAMNMALDGASREQIAAQIESEFGSFDGVDRLVDDVLGRAGR